MLYCTTKGLHCFRLRYYFCNCWRVGQCSFYYETFSYFSSIMYYSRTDRQTTLEYKLNRSNDSTRSLVIIEILWFSAVFSGVSLQRVNYEHKKIKIININNKDHIKHNNVADHLYNILNIFLIKCFRITIIKRGRLCAL